MEPTERKEMILQEAKKLFAVKGYYQTQISDIIREAGIARGTIYQYFKNKEDLFVSLLEKYYSQWEKNAYLAEDLDLAAVSPREYFFHRIRRTLEFFAQDQDVCRIYLRMGLGLPGELESTISRFEKKIEDIIVNDLNLGVRNGHVPEDMDVRLVANLLGGALLRTAYL
ncbi:MAG: TetR/AcrR family transcriptional regulator, partial [Pseudomonadota bacterium]